MKFENINGKNHIYLEDGDSLDITFVGPESKQIVINNKGGKPMFTDTYNPLKLVLDDGKTSKDDIIAKCYEWLQYFIEIHDKLKEIAIYLGDNYRLSLNMSTLLDPDTLKRVGKSISLCVEEKNQSLSQHRPYVLGPTISLYDENESIFKYLYAWILEFFIASNFKDKEISEESIIYGLFYEDDSHVMAKLIDPFFGNEYKDIARDIINNHNYYLDNNETLLRQLRDRIVNQKIVKNAIEFAIFDADRLFEVIKKDYPNVSKHGLG